ncbi:DUF885 family protein [Sphingomonas sp. dw_22]|uniref:DUF885 domain-containing protein n=1 Tax=Sphingomonas sp. dw_22 TaxID=2721175 RepID=UPI001BD33BDA|nr:DUF885 family protein [Sphingomonas sp. dw_22]
MAKAVLALALLAGAPIPAPALAQPVAESAAETAADARFRALYTREWEWRRREIGIEDEDDSNLPIRSSLPDVSAATQAKRLAYLEQVEAALDGIRVAGLSPKAQVDYAVYHAQIDALVARWKFRDWEKPVGSSGGFWNGAARDARRPFRTEQDYLNFLSLMRDVPRYFDEQVANMRAGLARGFTAPRVTLAGRDKPLAAIADAASPEATPFYAPFREMPASIPAARQAALRAQAVALIRDAVIPAHRKVLTFFRDVYVPGARETLAAEALPDGKAYYRSKIREFVTLDLAPDAIHQIGLKEVAKIQAEMVATMRATGFTGDLHAFFDFLRTDPRFYPTSEEQLLREAAWIAKRFDAKADLWFGRMPRRRFGITPMPAATAPFSTYALGGPGYFLLNTYNLPQRPLYVLTALTLHESAPGHGFQMPLAEENADQPDFRRKVYMSAYGEGWGLYCERLGVEMGMYQTPYDLFGMLNYQIWRAVRLVVDTGIHARGWSRDQAIRYMKDNTSLTDQEITTEVDRYIAGPGQALSYYLGEMAIVEGRAKAEKSLGAKFDIRNFHDMVLELGSVPLPVLSTQIEHFIAEGGKNPKPNL